MSNVVQFKDYNKYFDDNGWLKTPLPHYVIDSMPQSGDCEYWATTICEEISFKVPRELAIQYLIEFGSWEEDELDAMEDALLAHIVLWIAVGDIREQGEWFGLVH